MLGIGIVVGLLGYGLVFYGDQLWNGCAQNSFLAIMWPGGQKFIPCKPSSGSSSGSPYVPPGTTPKTRKAMQTAATAPGTPHR